MNSHLQHNLSILLGELRLYFTKNGFLEVQVPPIVSNPGMEAHLHPFEIKSKYNNKDLNLYLHTSPEFYMKKLLSEGLEKIYNISFSFRDEPDSETHRKQFMMLEWYRSNTDYSAIKKDTDNIINKSYLALGKKSPLRQYVTVDELFQNHLGFSILNFLSPKDLKEKIQLDFPQLIQNHSDLWPWEDYFFLLFLNKIEPHFKSIPYLMVDQFPAPLSALSTIDKNDPRICHRFEVYLNGLEVANCFNELTDTQEQKIRFDSEEKKKMSLYNYKLPQADVLYSALEKGLPPSSGIALGVERLLYSITSKESFLS
jgi:lysyl-tRNA synthetase class 2